MFYDFSGPAAALGYGILANTVTPRPIAWITSCDETGRVNAAPYSFFNAMGGSPPTLAVGFLAGVNDWKDSARNIRERGEFVVHLVSQDLAAVMNQTSAAYPPEVSEAEVLGIDLLPSARIDIPRIAAARVAFECRLVQFVETGPFQGTAVAEVLGAHISDAAITNPARGHIDREALELIARLDGRSRYARDFDIFDMPRPEGG